MLQNKEQVLQVIGDELIGWDENATFLIAIVFTAIAVGFAGSMAFTQNFKRGLR